MPLAASNEEVARAVIRKEFLQVPLEVTPMSGKEPPPVVPTNVNMISHPISMPASMFKPGQITTSQIKFVALDMLLPLAAGNLLTGDADRLKHVHDFIHQYDFLHLNEAHVCVDTEYQQQTLAVLLSIRYHDPFLGCMYYDRLIEEDTLYDTRLRQFYVTDASAALHHLRTERIAELMAAIDYAYQEFAQ